jgi:hypothetical protein
LELLPVRWLLSALMIVLGMTLVVNEQDDLE